VIAAFGAAILSAVCYGLASVLQARAARGTGGGERATPRMLVRVLRQSPFLVGMLLDLVGFAGQVLALRGLRPMWRAGDRALATTIGAVCGITALLFASMFAQVVVTLLPNALAGLR